MSIYCALQLCEDDRWPRGRPVACVGTEFLTSFFRLRPWPAGKGWPGIGIAAVSGPGRTRLSGLARVPFPAVGAGCAGRLVR